MCGIGGIYNIDRQKPINKNELRLMNSVQHHRGPDAEGLFIDEGFVGLAHTRLAIIDLKEQSNQPFHFSQTGLTITYNGEIFNYIELRKELEQFGYRFDTDSDTEVLIKTYDKWREDMVSHLNGMWAFAIYDSKDKTLFCSRDRFGIKPFNYTCINDRLIFASEIKAILAVEPEAAIPNYTSLAFVLKKSIGAQYPESCFRNIYRLPPAHNLIVKNGKFSLIRYWNYPAELDNSLSFESAAEKLKELLSDSVRIRMRSDVPVGISLSGGLDSSAIAKIAGSLQQNIPTFTSVYEKGHHSEFPMAKKFADSIGLESNAVICQGTDAVSLLKKIIYHLESPHAAPAVMPYWNIVEQASRRVKVLLEGQGADELLAGYVSGNLPLALMDLCCRRKFRQAIKEIRTIYRTSKIESGYGFPGPLGYAFMAMRMLFPWGHDLYRRLRGDEYVYCGELQTKLPHLPDQNPRYRGIDYLNMHLMRQHNGGLVNLLHYGDAISMAFSLETRVPFLDYRLVEFSFRLPGEYKLHNGYGKWILRKALDSDLPPYITQPRNKFGFSLPIIQWLREKPEQIIYPVLFSQKCKSRGIFDFPQLQKLVNQHISCKKNHFSQIYRWIITELWFQVFIDKKTA